MRILHNTCSQKIKVFFAFVLTCCHLLCRWKFRFMHLICINYFLSTKDWQHNAWNGNGSQWPTFTLYYQILWECKSPSCQAVFLQNTAHTKIRQCAVLLIWQFLSPQYFFLQANPYVVLFCLNTELPFKNISQVYLQNIPKLINYFLIAYACDNSSWHLDIPPLLHRSL